ncbi:hypothetical protein [Leptospira limi]|uniref:Uncharacterized protein n=1 Tax=Leptospira limi TaxID=2950023 RepID=A0ABT3M258_9LEPT|nr:hypothetical protein [Leptospira limi]MCW7464064.1 hypothetical protein [Leptospira limi]
MDLFLTFVSGESPFKSQMIVFKRKTIRKIHNVPLYLSVLTIKNYAFLIIPPIENNTDSFNNYLIEHFPIMTERMNDDVSIGYHTIDLSSPLLTKGNICKITMAYDSKIETTI